MIRLFKKKSVKLNALQIPAAEQKKLYKKAADNSAEYQRTIIKKYESTFGERIEKNR